MEKHFKSIVKAALISVYLIFLAGSIVRMTGSGMGCPDWPKCFGYYIPPTSEEQINWQPNTSYNKGTIIIKNEALIVAKDNFSTQNTFNESHWEAYTKHDYAIFNVYHTWTEYINRLSSVLSGFVFLILLVAAYKNRKLHKQILLLTFGAFFLMLFEAWLGKTVIDSVLKPSVITIHMVAGLFIIALLLKLLHLISDKVAKNISYNKTFHTLLIVSILFSIIQISMGTQVRQFVDEQVKLFGFDNKQMSLYNPNLNFYIHRSFTVAIVLVNFFIFYKNETLQLNFKLPKWILGLIGLEALTGILMYYSDFPLGTQAIHLLSGALLFGLQFYLILQHGKLKQLKK
ncbi:COX15/CtaA family protein [Flavicella sediminum]|uniref:COX15/CtaA family protein n=1 Tax=Flavicella sediminum TaxID=2585141 RepID=UPI001122239A|nr:COX15/CtaA family protein [Flavicella sediminum]